MMFFKKKIYFTIHFLLPFFFFLLLPPLPLLTQPPGHSLLHLNVTSFSTGLFLRGHVDHTHLRVLNVFTYTLILLPPQSFSTEKKKNLPSLIDEFSILISQSKSFIYVTHPKLSIAEGWRRRLELIEESAVYSVTSCYMSGWCLGEVLKYKHATYKSVCVFCSSVTVT